MGTDPRMKNSISFGSFHLRPAERLLERTGEAVHLATVQAT
jgi:DNA-binding winged helix-turn-helix (wHTH) protein